MRTTLAKLAYKLSRSVKKSHVIRDPEFRKICTGELAWVITHFV